MSISSLFLACASSSRAGESAADAAASDAGSRADAAPSPADASDIDARELPPPDAGPSGIMYVSMNGMNSNSGMTPDMPVKSVATAITRAASCVPTQCKVWISAGTYDEAITLASGVSLYGGYAAGFLARDRDAYETVLTSTESRTVIADSLSSDTTIDGLTIEGASYQGETTGASTYALFVRNSGQHLTLRDVKIEAGWAADGTKGMDGSVTTCAALGGQGGAAFNCGGGTGSPGSAGGDPVVGGGGGGAGSSNCPNACPLIGGDGVSGGDVGTKGEPGAAGANGVASTDADGSFLSDLWVGGTGTPGERGTHGTGGGGGGSGGTKKFVACFGCGTLLGGRGGDGAPGGCAGGGGQPGTAGGGSFGIALLTSTVRVSNVTVTSGVGGDGGTGGDGAVGAPGGTDVDDGIEPAGTQRCGLIDYRSGAGAVGGVGGKGGHGGGGAGGAGGVAIGVALVGGGAVTELEPGALGTDVGVPGSGGSGGAGDTSAPTGVTGLAAATHSF